MRIDKFLWCVRYFKTRSIAAEVCKKNQVWINNETAKPSREVMPSDVVKVRKNQIHYQFQIIQLPVSRMGAKLVSLYIKDMTDPEELERLELRQLDQDYYREKGEGRPTKRDRRDLDGFLDGWD